MGPRLFGRKYYGGGQIPCSAVLRARAICTSVVVWSKGPTSRSPQATAPSKYAESYVDAQFWKSLDFLTEPHVIQVIHKGRSNSNQASQERNPCLSRESLWAGLLVTGPVGYPDSDNRLLTFRPIAQYPHRPSLDPRHASIARSGLPGKGITLFFAQ